MIAEPARNGADMMCQRLHAHGVRVLFGHPGGAILPFYDALYRDGRIRHVLMRHELGAAHAADGYARATGEVGVCVATSGPGATNLVTGLATAMMDSVPMVAITGQVARSALGTEAFQETDILGITAPVTKYGFFVDDAESIVGVLDEAFALARTGRPGPVVVDVPKDVQAQIVQPRPEVSRRDASTRPAVLPMAEIERAAALLDGAERPVLMVGRGVLLGGVVEQVRRLAEWAELPVVTSLLGLDAFPARHPLALGLPGMHGTPRANYAIQEADVLLGLGVRFDDRIVGRAEDFAPRARVIHFEIDSSVVGRTVSPDIVVLGDLAHTLPLLSARMRPRTRPAWLARMATWDRDAEPRAMLMGDGPPSSRDVLRVIAGQVSRTRAIVATDVGQHQMWLAQELPDVEPGAHLTSGGLGTMGYALPAGIGAALARPDREVWVVAGDGGFQMNVQELATVVQEGARLRIAVVNNGYLGMVRQWQELFYDRRYSQSAISGPDFSALAEAYGMGGLVVRRADQVETAVSDAAGHEGPMLLDIRVAREENVYPIVPSGAALHELVRAPVVAG